MENNLDKISQTPATEATKESSETISETRKRVEKKYLARPRPESDFGKIGDVKIIDGKIFAIQVLSQQTRASGYCDNRLIVLDHDLNEIFSTTPCRYYAFTNYTDENTIPEDNLKNPEQELKEIISLKDNTLEVLNEKGETLYISLPEGLLEKN